MSEVKPWDNSLASAHALAASWPEKPAAGARNEPEPRAEQPNVCRDRGVEELW